MKRFEIGLFVVLALLILFTFTDYGITWDESLQYEYGRLVWQYFRSGGHDRAYAEFHNLRFYSPLFDLASYLAAAPFAGREHEAKHLFTALTGLLTALAVFRIGRLTGKPNVPFFAALSLLLLPRFYGHMFNNPKDIPFACAFAWAMWGIMALFVRGRFRWRDIAVTGGLMGIALAVRPGAMILFPFLIMSAGFAFARRFPRPSLPDLRVALTPTTAAKATALVALAWLVMVAPWPWAHENPLLHPVRAFGATSGFDEGYPMLYMGASVLSSKLPWHYVPHYLLITTPPVLLVLFFGGLLVCVREQVRNRTSSQSLVYLILELWLFFMLFYLVLKRPSLYDGIRHLLFLLPAAALFCGTGAAWLARRIDVRRWIPARVLVVLLLSAPVVPAMIRLHPYQTTYFNCLAGGLRRAGHRYETDYWGASYREAMQWVNRKAARSDGPITVLAAVNYSSYLCVEQYAGSNVVVRRSFGRWTDRTLPAGHDYYVALRRFGFDKNFPDAPVVHTVGRDGIVFTVVKAGANGQSCPTLVQ